MQDGKIIQLRPGAHVSLSLKKSDGVCRHRSVTVIENDRSLVCKSCDAVLDPWDYLFSWAKREHNLHYEHKYLQSQVDALRKQLAELKRLVRNAKAARRRANVIG